MATILSWSQCLKLDMIFSLHANDFGLVFTSLTDLCKIYAKIRQNVLVFWELIFCLPACLKNGRHCRGNTEVTSWHQASVGQSAETLQGGPDSWWWVADLHAWINGILIVRPAALNYSTVSIFSPKIITIETQLLARERLFWVWIEICSQISKWQQVIFCVCNSLLPETMMTHFTDVYMLCISRPDWVISFCLMHSVSALILLSLYWYILARILC